MMFEGDKSTADEDIDICFSGLEIGAFSDAALAFAMTSSIVHVSSTTTSDSSLRRRRTGLMIELRIIAPALEKDMKTGPGRSGEVIGVVRFICHICWQIAVIIVLPRMRTTPSNYSSTFFQCIDSKSFLFGIIMHILFHCRFVKNPIDVGMQ